MDRFKTIKDRANDIISQAADSSDPAEIIRLFGDLATEFHRLKMEYTFEFGIKALDNHSIEKKIQVEVQKRLKNMELSEFHNSRGNNNIQVPMNVAYRR